MGLESAALAALVGPALGGRVLSVLQLQKKHVMRPNAHCVRLGKRRYRRTR